MSFISKHMAAPILTSGFVPVVLEILDWLEQCRSVNGENLKNRYLIKVGYLRGISGMKRL
jgi:hypothetical protein